MNKKNNQKIHLYLIAVVFLCFAFYFPGLNGGWVFDDFHNIVKNPDINAFNDWDAAALWDATWSSHAGVFKRPISMFTFAVNHAVFGMDPYYFKLFNLLIHLLNGLLIFVLTRILCDFIDGKKYYKYWLPLVVAAVWMLHPLQMSSVLYVVQRMNSLCATFVLGGLIFYVRGRVSSIKNQEPNYANLCMAFFLFLPLAALTKENGVLLAPLIALVELCFFSFKASSKKEKRFLFCLFSIFLIFPILFILASLIIQPQFFISGYAGRDFSIDQRVITQSRLIFIYLKWILFPRISDLGLYHDDIPISIFIKESWSTIASVAGVSLLILYLFVGAFLKKIKSSFLYFGVGVFLVGHSMESSILPLEMVHEHRNYLPSYGIILIAINYIFTVYYLLKKTYAKWFFIFIASIFGMLTALGTWQRAQDWSHPAKQAAVDAMNHPQSARSQVAYANWLEYLAAEEESLNIQKLSDALDRYKKAAALEKYALTPLINALRLENSIGHPNEAKKILEDIEVKLKKPPLSPATTESVIDFIVCNHSGKCEFSESDILKIVYAIRNNPRLRKIQEARILTEVVNFMLKKGHFGTAIAFSQEAAELAPEDAQTRMNFIILLNELGYQDEAVREMKKIESISMSSIEKKRYISLQQEIN